MRKYSKILAICMIAILSLGMMSACSGTNYSGKDNSFLGQIHGISKAVQDIEERRVVAENETYNYIESGASGGESTNPGGESSNPGGESSNPGEEPSNPGEEPGNPGEEPSNPESGGETPNYTLKCMSFNVLAWDSWYANFAQPVTRAPWVVKTIKKFDPDLLGTQELSGASAVTGNFSMYDYLKDNLTEYQHFNADEVCVGNTLFFKKDRFDLLDCGFLNTDTSAADRGANWVKLYDKVDGIHIMFTNTHQSPDPMINGVHSAEKGNELRKGQATKLLNFLESNVIGDMASYSTGDYNATLVSEPVSILLSSKFISSRDVAAVANRASTIDHVFINGDIQGCYEFHTCMDMFPPEGVEASEQDNQYKASDHWAVIAYCSNEYRQ